MNFDFGEGRFSIHCLSVKFYFGVLFGMLRFFLMVELKSRLKSSRGGKKRQKKLASDSVGRGS